MSISPGFTAEQIREFVFAYEHQRHGTKAVWLKEQGISYERLKRWRDTIIVGDLDRGLVPREGSAMTSRPRRRLAAQHCDAQDQQAEVEKLNQRVQELEATNEALGKAIGLLHKLNEQEPGTSETNEPNNS